MGIESFNNTPPVDSEIDQERPENVEYKLNRPSMLWKGLAAFDAGFLYTLKEAYITSDEEREKRKAEGRDLKADFFKGLGRTVLNGYEAMGKIAEVEEESSFDRLTRERQEKIDGSISDEEKQRIIRELEALKQSRAKHLDNEQRDKETTSKIFNIIKGVFS